MVVKILAAVVLFVIWFYLINIVWAEILTIQRGYQLANVLGVSGDENIYDLIADISLIVSTIGACISTLLCMKFFPSK